MSVIPGEVEQVAKEIYQKSAKRSRSIFILTSRLVVQLLAIGAAFINRGERPHERNDPSDAKTAAEQKVHGEDRV